MKFKNNENGYALLMVILLVLLFTTLGMGLLAMNINASKQFNNKEEQVQARHLAEMGLLHYKAEVKDKIKDYKFTLMSGEKENEAIERSRIYLCQEITKLKLPILLGENGKYTTSDRIINGCSPGSTGEIKISLRSTGESINGTDKIVDASIEITPPQINVGNKNPSNPEVPKDDEAKGEDKGLYTVKNGPLKIDNEDLEFDNLVIKRSLTETDSNKKDERQTLQFGPGSKKGDKKYLKIKENLIVEGTIYSHNHACIYVKGDMTVKGNMYLNNKSIVLVYGNAYFKGEVKTHTNAKIFVAGNAYKGINQLPTDDYETFSGFNDKCKALPDWPDPNTYQPDTKQYSWMLEEELSPYYH